MIHISLTYFKIYTSNIFMFKYLLVLLIKVKCGFRLYSQKNVVIFVSYISSVNIRIQFL